LQDSDRDLDTEISVFDVIAVLDKAGAVYEHAVHRTLVATGA
jgi:hypothetical protein